LSKSKKSNDEKKESLTGCTSANFHEAGRSEYLAQFVFSSFGTATPIPRQEDTGLDLLCTLGERDGQRLWPIASYSVQVKSTPGPWEFAAERSIQWIVEHPLPIFWCLVDKKTATLSIYHTSPRFHAWASNEKLERLVIIFGEGTFGLGEEWDKIGREKRKRCEFSVGAPIAKFSVTEILDSDFHATIFKVLQAWIESDQRNIVRMQTGQRQYETLEQYETNVPPPKHFSISSRHELDAEERTQALDSFLEHAKWLNTHFASSGDYRGFLRMQLLLHHLNCHDTQDSNLLARHFLSQLECDFPARDSDSTAGLNELDRQLDELSDSAIQKAKRDVIVEKEEIQRIRPDFFDEPEK